MNPWQWLLETLRWGLTELHDLFEPLAGAHSWGWAIIALTLIIRVFLLPLAAKQFKSMRAMQALNPEMQKIRKKYKVDRDLMKKNPEKYKAQKQKMNEEVMGLYQEHGVNPAASCLPLLLQAPIFFALFRILWAEADRIEEMVAAPFYVFSPLGQTANASIWGWVLIVGMAVTMFVTQRQMMGANPASEGMQATQQKVMLYGMPVFLGVVAQGLPKGVLVYWVTTNGWQLAQQQLILYEIHREERRREARGEDGKRSEGVKRRDASADDVPQKGARKQGTKRKGAPASGAKQRGEKKPPGVPEKRATDKGAKDKGAKDKGAKDKGAKDKGAKDKGAAPTGAGEGPREGAGNGQRASGRGGSDNGQRRGRDDRHDHIPRRRRRRDDD